MTQKLKDLASEPGVIPKHWSSCGQMKSEKSLVTFIVYTAQFVVILKMNMLLYFIFMIHVYVCKGGSKNPRKTGQPGFLSLLKCVRQHMWHLLGSNLQSSAVTHD